jgi:hypothetical protein
VGVSLLVYEVGYIAVLLAPALLLTRQGLAPKRLVRSAALWFAVPLLNGIRILLLLRSEQELYEESLMIQTSRAPGKEVTGLVKRVFADGVGGFLDGPFGMTLTASAVVLLAICVAQILSSSRSEPEDVVDSDLFLDSRRLTALTIASFASAPIVALIYVGHPVLLVDPLRIFSIAGLFLTIGLACVNEGLARVRRALGVLVAILLVLASTASATAQRDAWHRRSMFQEHVLGSLVSVAVSVRNPQGVVVVDPNHVIGDDHYTFLPTTLRTALLYLIPDVGNVLLCRLPVAEMPATAQSPTECTVDNRVVSNALGSISLDSALVIEIRHSGPGDGWSGQPVRAESNRVRSVLPCIEAGTCDSGPAGVQARLISLGGTP